MLWSFPPHRTGQPMNKAGQDGDTLESGNSDADPTAWSQFTFCSGGNCNPNGVWHCAEYTTIRQSRSLKSEEVRS